MAIVCKSERFSYKTLEDTPTLGPGAYTLPDEPTKPNHIKVPFGSTAIRDIASIPNEEVSPKIPTLT